jgi:hypothetical protein
MIFYKREIKVVLLDTLCHVEEDLTDWEEERTGEFSFLAEQECYENVTSKTVLMKERFVRVNFS